MANVLTVTGNTRVSWSLSDQQAIGPVGRSAEQKSSRSITTGTGPNQANVAHTQTYLTTGMNSLSITMAEIPAYAFGFEGVLAVQTVKELLIQITTGPTGGFVTVSMPTGITGVRVHTGGQFHWIDYLAGISPADNLTVQNGITGTFGIELSLIGNGSFSNI